MKKAINTAHNPIKKWQQLQRNAQDINLLKLPQLYKKDGLIAVLKPYGVPVHSGPKQKFSVVDYFPTLEHKYNLPAGSLELANRIDKHVSGVLLLTYKREMAQYIADLQRKHQIEKEYLTVVLGSTQRTFGKLVGNCKTDRRLQTVDRESVTSSDDVAVTEYKILDNNKLDCMLCLFTTCHGQKHQIRVHAKELLNAPILGDHKYHHGPRGPQPLTLRMMQVLRMQGLLQESGKGRFRPWQRGLVPLHLFARQVLIPGLDSSNPADGAVTISAPLPPYFADTLKNLDLEENRYEMEDAIVDPKRYEPPPFSMVVSGQKVKGPSPFHVNKESSF